MIVFLAGMQRSGSTFSFNIVREVLERRGAVYQEASGAALPVLKRCGAAEHVLFKGHSADNTMVRLVQLGAVRAVCTVRKPEDAIASWMEAFGFSLETSLGHMHDWLTMFARIRNHALVVRYEQIDLQPLHAARQIVRYVCPEASLLETANIARVYSKKNVKALSDKIEKEDARVKDVGFSHYDATTFFHRRHVSTLVSRSATERIGAKAVKLIRKSLRPHTNAKGDL